MIRVLLSAAAGAVIAVTVIFLLVGWNRWDALNEDVKAAIGTIFAGSLSFLGGYIEHRRAERSAARRLGGKNGKNGNGDSGRNHGKEG